MSRMIFPTDKKSELGDSAAISTIDYDQVQKSLSEMKGEKVAQSEIDQMKKSAAKSNKKDEAKKHKVIEEAKFDGFCETCGVPHPCSCDVVAAEISGDKVKLASILKQRANRRTSMVASIEENMNKVAVSQRNQLRTALMQGIDEIMEESVKESVKEKLENVDEFVDATAMTQSQKDKFSKFAAEKGWPKEYVSAIIESQVKKASIPNSFRVVAENKKINKDTKVNILSAMLKESKLSLEQSNRIIDYWKNDLGYQDVEWINELVEEPSGK